MVELDSDVRAYDERGREAERLVGESPAGPLELEADAGDSAPFPRRPRRPSNRLLASEVISGGRIGNRTRTGQRER
jgi:hypothetical protein